MGATWGPTPGTNATAGGIYRESWTLVLMYVLSPEKYVLVAAIGDPGGGYAACALILFDLAGAAAFVTAILPEEPFPPPLLVGYAVAALAMFAFPLAICVGNCNNNAGE